jgi:hypothetical protein
MCVDLGKCSEELLLYGPQTLKCQLVNFFSADVAQEKEKRKKVLLPTGFS